MSVSRACDFFLANNSNWYIMLGINEHDEDWADCYAIGPFLSLEEAETSLANAPYPNTGQSTIDDSGCEPAPTVGLNTKTSLLNGKLRY